MNKRSLDLSFIIICLVFVGYLGDQKTFGFSGTISDQPSCESAGGTWTMSPEECTISGQLFIDEDDSFANSVTFNGSIDIREGAPSPTLVSSTGARATSTVMLITPAPLTLSCRMVDVFPGSLSQQAGSCVDG